MSKKAKSKKAKSKKAKSKNGSKSRSNKSQKTDGKKMTTVVQEGNLVNLSYIHRVYKTELEPLDIKFFKNMKVEYHGKESATFDFTYSYGFDENNLEEFVPGGLKEFKKLFWMESYGEEENENFIQSMFFKPYSRTDKITINRYKELTSEYLNDICKQFYKEHGTDSWKKSDDYKKQMKINDEGYKVKLALEAAVRNGMNGEMMTQLRNFLFGKEVWNSSSMEGKAIKIGVAPMIERIQSNEVITQKETEKKYALLISKEKGLPSELQSMVAKNLSYKKA